MFRILAIGLVVGTFIGCSTNSQESNTAVGKPEIISQPLDLSQGKSEQGELGTYRDSLHFFTVRFPKDWEHVAVQNPETRISLKNQKADGSLNAGFNVVVDHDPSIGELSPERHADHLKRHLNDSLDLVRSSVDAPLRVIQRGEVRISSQLGYYTLFDLNGGNSETALRFLQMAAYRDGRTYSLTFSCKPANYDALLPVFKQIAATFVITPPTK
ncbi:MAG TPA: hypothetical protein PKD26_14090 [Pyrinomonadaceae bacterium]|nr:hypothetical protein [Pyrinomonadaceae bacterium]